MRIIYSKTKYAGEFVVEDHHAEEEVSLIWEITESRERTLVLIYPGNMKTVRKETMAPKDNTKTWEYYEYPEVVISFLVPEA